MISVSLNHKPRQLKLRQQMLAAQMKNLRMAKISRDRTRRSIEGACREKINENIKASAEDAARDNSNDDTRNTALAHSQCRDGVCEVAWRPSNQRDTNTGSINI